MTDRVAGAESQDVDHGVGLRADDAEAGLTLIEVLVAMVVLAVGLLAVAGMAGAVATHTDMGGGVTGQAAAGQDVLEELHMKGYDDPALDPGEHTREVTVASRTYTVTYQVNTLILDELKEAVAVVEATQSLPPDTLRTLVARTSGPAPLP